MRDFSDGLSQSNHGQVPRMAERLHALPLQAITTDSEQLHLGSLLQTLHQVSRMKIRTCLTCNHEEFHQLTPIAWASSGR